MRSPRLRLLVTLLLAAVAWSARFVLLPGVQAWKMRSLWTPSSDTSATSIVAIGITPALSAFVMVELAALVVPRWRSLRRGLPEQRRVLVRAALVCTFVFASLQGFFVARVLQSATSGLVEDPSLSTTLLITATLVGGTFFLLGLATLVDRFGLMNGFAALLALGVLASVRDLGVAATRELALGNIAASDVLTIVVEIALVVVATAFILGAHRRARVEPSLVAVRHPTSGLAPIMLAASLLVLPRSLESLGVHARALAELAPGQLVYELFDGVLVVLLTIGLSAAFNRPAVIGRALVRSSGLMVGTLDAGMRGVVEAAIFRSTLFLVGVSVLGFVARSVVHVRLSVELPAIVVLTALGMDLVAERRARWAHDDLVPVWPLHQLALIEPALAALRHAEIPVHARAQYYRALLWFFGPYIPVELMVPAARATEAYAVLRTVLVED